MPVTSEPVAIIGVGTMGHGMATSALRAGIPTIVWDRTPAATQSLAELGAEVAGSAADAARRAAIVVTMVPDAERVVATALADGTSVALAPRLGLDAKTMIDALEAGPLVSPWQSAKLQRIVSGDFSAQFALRLALKDVRLALDAAGDGRFDTLRSLADEWQEAVGAG